MVVQKSQISDVFFLNIVSKSVTTLSKYSGCKNKAKTNILIHYHAKVDPHEQDENFERTGAIPTIYFCNFLREREFNRKYKIIYQELMMGATGNSFKRVI